MKIRRLTIILILLLAMVLSVAVFYGARHLIFNKIKLIIVKRIESASGLGIKIENAGCSLLNGVCLAGITFYKDNLHKEELFSASHVFVKFPIVKFLRKKPLTPTSAIHGFKCGPISVSGINITATLRKENEIYKISEFKGAALNSSFDFAGEISPTPSLYGTVNLNLKDLSGFTEGVLENSVYFKTDLKNAQNYELGIKSTADSLKVQGFELTGVRVDTRVEKGVANIPLFNAHFYGGAIAGSASFDLEKEGIPYRANAKLGGMKIAEVLEHTDLKGKGIAGNLSLGLSLEGEAQEINSAKGSGKIIVENANLGPMPLLTPLLGHVYGYFQRVVPELKKVNIKSGSADFYIHNRRVITDNLTLSGDAVGITAKGYLGFDRNLNFDVENKILLEEGKGGDDWQRGLQSLIVNFGKMISRARLTGTLEKPKWKFEYLGGVQNIFKGGLENILKDILE